MDSFLEMYLKSGKTSTPKRGKGQRISQKNYKYHSDFDKEDYEVQFGSHISKKPPLKRRKVQKDSSKKISLYSMVKEKYKQTEFETVQNEEDNLNENRSLKKIENRLKELSEECRNLKIQTTNLAALMNSVKELPSNGVIWDCFYIHI
ncbi:uncharacterized protein LOC124456846 isoform X2 [Xenia sp. Carnegie-2017]|uniref:uncharacterized protein LOC124456846 isoform X2 n=1 Tax=Xenia sp. Carnegie-2017 TaxID=2897299 RepID=UPI001F033839|nr:uncharacterized protein LOC124456846 isoform X2 [Xenia sp. Carnegie-2017]